MISHPLDLDRLPTNHILAAAPSVWHALTTSDYLWSFIQYLLLAVVLKGIDIAHKEVKAYLEERKRQTGIDEPEE